MALHASDVPDLLKAQRRAAGLTQEELASRVGTSQSAIARWESGRTEPRLSALRDLMAACGKELSLTVSDGVDRSLIRERLAMTPDQRLDSNRQIARLRGGGAGSWLTSMHSASSRLLTGSTSSMC